MRIVGVGFRPTEEELLNFYLKHKLLADDPSVQVIPLIDLCEVEPWDVPVMFEGSVIRFNDPEWFFFSHVDYKYSNSKRINRKTKCGFWKPTGKDRDIRAWDTNTVIGTKKTLVYYQGRVSCCHKSNWVIHEYHAVTFHESQRKFVLCRLVMKKPEKTAEGGIDAPIEEPSRSMVSVYENLATAEGTPSEGTFTGMETIFQASPQADKSLTPIQQSPTSIEKEETSFTNYSHNNVYFRNENNVTQTSFQTTEEEEFLNFILADESIVIDEEIIHGFVNSSTQYCKSSDTDAEVVSKLDHTTVDISTVCNEYPNSDDYGSSKRFKSSHDVVHSDICFPSSTNEENQENNEDSMFKCYFWGVETSSCESTAGEVNSIEIPISPFTPEKWENQYLIQDQTTSYDGNENPKRTKEALFWIIKQ